VDLIADVAESKAVHGVWAGWGHASENPRLPERISEIANGKIAFLGPGPDAMRALGDKVGSTIIAQSVGVPTLPWSGAGMRCDYANGGIPEETYAKAVVATVEQAIEAAGAVGFPLMVKASEGGGGKGIRKASNVEELRIAFRHVQSEVVGSPVFLMALAQSTRHLEVQVLADNYGNAIALYGRDCSVQRRHQKIIEEGPPIAADPSVFRQMEDDAVRLAKTVGYVSVGTVEYLYHDGTYYFLEMNTRLQVEHPISEMITNVNLPAAMLAVAMGVPLHNIPDVAAFLSLPPPDPLNLRPATYPIDSNHRREALGHVIAARITAENPDANFQPTSGSITELKFRTTPNVWG
jgi:biotin carboxylase